MESSRRNEEDADEERWREWCIGEDAEERHCRGTWNLLSHRDSTTPPCSPAARCPFKQAGDLLGRLEQIMERRGGFIDPSLPMAQWHKLYRGKRMIASLEKNWHPVPQNHEGAVLVANLCVMAFFLDPRRKTVKPRFFYGAACWGHHPQGVLEDTDAYCSNHSGWLWVRAVLRNPEGFRYHLHDTTPWEPKRGWKDDQAVYFRAIPEHGETWWPRYGVLVAAPIDVITDPRNAARLGDRLTELWKEVESVS